MTSLVCVPRETASCLPSCEKSNQKIWSVLKSVNCFGGPPSRGSDQMLETPLIVSMYVTARPSGAQRSPAARVKLGRGRSSTLTGSPPAQGMMASLMGVFGCSSSRYQQATRLPSGETVGFDVHLSVNCTGSPPSIETFQTLNKPERVEGKTTQRPSGEVAGTCHPALRRLVL